MNPVLRLASGQEIPLDPLTIPPNASVSRSVNEGLLTHAPNLLNQPGSYGSVVFRFTSHHAMNLHAAAVVAISGVPIAFLSSAHPAGPAAHTLRGNGPGSLEGIWWQPRLGLQDILVISNSSEKTINGTLSLFDASGKQWSEALSLGPYQTQRMATSDLLQQAGLSGGYGGISFAVAASAPAVDAVHFMFDEATKFSLSLDLSSRDPNATVRDRTGSLVTQWAMRAPMLALSTPDPALGLPSGTMLEPTILVRNTTSKKISASLTLGWRGDSGKGQTNLPELELAPFGTQQLQIGAIQKQLGIPNDAHWALVTLSANALPDDVVALASSRDSSGRYHLETKFFGDRGGAFAGGEWRADTTHNEIVAITNVGAKATNALLTLHYDNGGKKYELQQIIQPGDQMWVNLTELIHDQVPDRSGNALPADVSSVTYDLQDLTPAGNSLTASTLAVNNTLGNQMIPDCPNCCGDSYIFFSPATVYTLIDEAAPVTVYGVNSCSGSDVNLDGDFPTWGSDNSSIATVTTGMVRGVAAGSTTAYAIGDVPDPGVQACGCPLYHEVQLNAPVTVAPPTPINFRQTSVIDAGSGDLRFTYAWNSSSGTLSDLSNCTVGEIVTYPGSQNPFPFPSPPFPAVASPNPTVDDLAATTGTFQDDNKVGTGIFVRPYSASSFTATQNFRYKCTNYNGGNYVNLMGPLSIVRSVSMNTNGTWKFTGTKPTGGTATINPLP